MGGLDGTAELQLFAHLDGEALNVALLMPVVERDKWEDLSNGLSDYYNSPGRLAMFRQRFESASHRPGADLATFATELGIILAVRGFGDMGKRARDSMVRECRKVIRSENRARMLVGTGILWESLTSPRMSDASRRSCRSFRRV